MKATEVKVESKKKRGRPSIICDELCKGYQSLFPDIKTKRGLINHHYASIAWEVVRELPDTTFLIDPSRDFHRESVLVELGRLRDHELISMLAREICDIAEIIPWKWTTKQWEKYARIRRRELDGRISEAASEIALNQLIPDRYRESHRVVSMEPLPPVKMG